MHFENNHIICIRLWPEICILRSIVLYFTFFLLFPRANISLMTRHKDNNVNNEKKCTNSIFVSDRSWFSIPKWTEEKRGWKRVVDGKSRLEGLYSVCQLCCGSVRDIVFTLRYHAMLSKQGFRESFCSRFSSFWLDSWISTRSHRVKGANINNDENNNVFCSLAKRTIRLDLINLFDDCLALTI